MNQKLNLKDVWFKLLLLVLFGFLLLQAASFPRESKQIPQIVAILTLIMILISLIVDFFKKKTAEGELTGVDDTELTVLDESAKKERRKRFYKAWGIILISTAIGFLGGFLFCTLFLFIGFAVLFGPKKNLFRNIVIAFAMTMVFYLTFQWIMMVPLLGGILR